MSLVITLHYITLYLRTYTSLLPQVQLVISAPLARDRAPSTVARPPSRSPPANCSSSSLSPAPHTRRHTSKLAGAARHWGRHHASTSLAHPA